MHDPFTVQYHIMLPPRTNTVFPATVGESLICAFNVVIEHQGVDGFPSPSDGVLNGVHKPTRKEH